MYIVGKMQDVIYGEIADYGERKARKEPVSQTRKFLFIRCEMKSHSSVLGRKVT